jgi:hypothetical protein
MNTTEQNIYWETHSLPSTPELSHLLWDKNIYCCARNSPPLTPSLSQKNQSKHPASSLYYPF